MEVSFESLVPFSDNDRLNKRVIVWCDLKGNNSCRNWNLKARTQFQKYNVQEDYQISHYIEPNDYLFPHCR